MHGVVEGSPIVVAALLEHSGKALVLGEHGEDVVGGESGAASVARDVVERAFPRSFSTAASSSQVRSCRRAVGVVTSASDGYFGAAIWSRVERGGDRGGGGSGSGWVEEVGKPWVERGEDRLLGDEDVAGWASAMPGKRARAAQR